MRAIQRRRTGTLCTAASALFSLMAPLGAGGENFRSAWPEDVERVWVGPEYWANRLQDWRIAGGRLECVEGRANKPMRTVHLLTRTLGRKLGSLRMTVRTGLIGDGEALSSETWSGFLIGAGGDELDYRAASLVHHFPGQGGGLIAAVDGKGEVVFRDNSRTTKEQIYPLIWAQSKEGTGFQREAREDIELRLVAEPEGEKYKVTLSAHDFSTGKPLGRTSLDGVEPSLLVGNVALCSHPGAAKGGACYWFRDWQVSGSKTEVHENRCFGPILCVLHTLTTKALKLTAQLAPVGESDSPIAYLVLSPAEPPLPPGVSAGQPGLFVGKVAIPGYTVTFRVPEWPSVMRAETQYTLAYSLREAGGKSKEYTYKGVIKRDPLDKESLVVAAFTGNANCDFGADQPAGTELRWTPNNLWFPHADLVERVKAHKPDVLVFPGDQVYEYRSPTAPEKNPEDKAFLDYLYKWYLWCWAYGDLARDTPTICLPDDHDVYHGNLWGWGGRKAPGADHNNGGYVMSPEFVNMVQRTQTSHLPDPYDPTPVEQGIGVYYAAMNYGGVSFAILEDRKFKSPPTVVKDAKISDGHIMTIGYDASRADVPGAELLGERQLKFLREWAADWRGGVMMKVAVSQTNFCNLQTRDYYPDKLDRDLDSNGWPQSGRNRALDELRRGFAFMINGDQHLGSVIRHGIEDWSDAGYSFCVPSIANYYVRFWLPLERGRNYKPGTPDYTGEYLDGLGNRITVWAVANPKRPEELTAEERTRPAAELHRKSPGYGIVRLNKKERTITMECWPRDADPKDSSAQYVGWPLTVGIEENYGRSAAGYLPTLNLVGMSDPVVQVVDEASGEIVYTIRAKGTSFRPKVFKAGPYTVRIGEPGTPRMRVLKRLRAVSGEKAEAIEVRF